jgi:hypothetical protein
MAVQESEQSNVLTHVLAVGIRIVRLFTLPVSTHVHGNDAMILRQIRKHTAFDPHSVEVAHPPALSRKP